MDDEGISGSVVAATIGFIAKVFAKGSRVGCCCGFEFERNGTKDVEIIGWNRAERYRGSGRGTGRRGGGRLLQRHVPLGEPARDTFAAHPRTWMHLKRGSLAGRSSYWFWTNTIAERDWHNDTPLLRPLPVYKLRDNFALPPLFLFLPFCQVERDENIRLIPHYRFRSIYIFII